MDNKALEALLSAIPAPALAIDGSEYIVAANSDALTLIGSGARDRHYMTILRQPALLDAIESTLQDGQPRSASYLGNDGAQDTTYRVSCRVAQVTDEVVVVLVFEDMTAMEAAGQVRRDFVANVSHELRTPLTALMGFIETLRGPARNDAKAAVRFLDIMQVEAERMNRLVGDLMSLNRVESDERIRPTDDVIVNDILESTIGALQHIADDAGIALEKMWDAVPAKIPGDPDQLKQVFTNLIENAIKYGGSGGKVTVRMAHSNHEPALRGPGVRVEIVDYGAGIDPVHLPRLTERFYRADHHRSRAMGGTGLGLAIVKHIINRHRGRLRVDSELGAGSVFSVILPVQIDSLDNTA